MRPGTFGAAFLFVAAAAGVAGTRPRLVETVRAVRAREDVYTLPPPAQLHAATLGWDAAAVDLLWAQLLVEYGIHWSEHREFREIPNYVDAILELEPSYAPLYGLVDTVLAYRPLQGTEDDVRRARAYLERGTRERPHDANVWMHYGQFVAFIAPGFLHDQADKDAWRHDGATAIGHAAELGSNAEGAITAASVLSRAGSTREAIRYFERAYAFTTDPSLQEVHENIGRRLATLQARAWADRADTVLRAVDRLWKSDLSYLTRDQYLILGPPVDVARCAGVSASSRPSCARDWTDAVGGEDADTVSVLSP